MAVGVKGLFITFEGSEGSGKSTQIHLLEEHLKTKEKSVLFVREPGGVEISERIREILLDVQNDKMGKECETLLYLAARAQLVEEVIRPALSEGKIILSDRFSDSTLVYQGYGHGIDLELIKHMGLFATQNIQPDLTIVFDIEAEKGLSRIDRDKDRIELRSMDYHNRVRDGYLQLAQNDPGRIKCIDVNRSKEDIHLDVLKYIGPLMDKL